MDWHYMHPGDMWQLLLVSVTNIRGFHLSTEMVAVSQKSDSRLDLLYKVFKPISAVIWEFVDDLAKIKQHNIYNKKVFRDLQIVSSGIVSGVNHVVIPVFYIYGP